MPSNVEPLLWGLTGSATQQDLRERGMRQYPQYGADPRNLSSHRLGSREMATRFGTLPTAAAGAGKELYQGIASKVQGGDFLGPAGFDPQDMAANAAGILDANPWLRAIFNRVGPAATNVVNKVRNRNPGGGGGRSSGPGMPANAGPGGPTGPTGRPGDITGGPRPGRGPGRLTTPQPATGASVYFPGGGQGMTLPIQTQTPGWATGSTVK